MSVPAQISEPPLSQDSTEDIPTTSVGSVADLPTHDASSNHSPPKIHDGQPDPVTVVSPIQDAGSNHSTLHDIHDDQPDPVSVVSPGTGENVAKPRRPLRTRLGTLVIVTRLLTTIGLSISLSVISWIWFSNESDHNWYRLVLTNRLDIVVTVTSVCIRLAIATQVTTTISMLASLASESESHGGVELKRIPAMSTARFSTPDPLSALLLFWKRFRLGFNWPFVAILTMAYTSTVSQFTSTLLLRDLYIGQITDLPQSKDAPVGFGFGSWVSNYTSGLVYQNRNYWTSPPSSFPSFAQWSETPKIEVDSVKDTGPTLRAFLPIVSADTRASLIGYEGIADVFDTRVICSRPIIKIKEDDGDEYIGTLVHGSFTEEISRILRVPANRSTTFSIPKSELIPGSILFKQLDLSQGGLINDLDPTINSTILNYTSFNDERSLYHDSLPWSAEGPKSWHESDIYPFQPGRALLVIWPSDTIPDIEPYFDVNQSLPVDNGVWTEYLVIYDSAAGQRITPRFNITVCYDAIFASNESRIKHHQSFPIRANRASNASELIMTWNPVAQNHDTTGVSELYIQSPKEHGLDYLFNLDREPIIRHLNALRDSWSPLNIAMIFTCECKFHSLSVKTCTRLGMLCFTGVRTLYWYYNTTLGIHIHDIHMLGDMEESAEAQKLLRLEMYDFVYDSVWGSFTFGNFEILTLCKQCSGSVQGEAVYLHPLLSSIVSDVFEATGYNPAATWQTLVTIVMSNAYYDLLPAFSRNDTIKTTSITQRLQPKERVGYTVVIATVFIQLLISISTLLLFWKRTRYSFLGNVWQAVSQVISPDTMPVLLRSTMVTDEECQLQDDSGADGADEENDSRLILREHADGRVVFQRHA